jgi:YidC/Oxa1 family membrane protein insertase
LAAHAYFQLLRDGKAPAGDSAMVNTYTGAAIYTEQDKFQKIVFGDLDKGKATVPKPTDNGWIAMLQHYFVSALLPNEKAPREYYAKRLEENLYSVGVILPIPAIAPNASSSVAVSLYAGPQEQDALKSIAPGLDLTVDYGWLTVVAAPLFWLLQFLHKWVANWGVAIILLTVLIKAVFFPLSAASYKSMAKMKLVTPRMTKLREQYGNDRARLNQAMMELYKTEKINPLGGCLPIVVQIPVFISLYWVLLASVELRHAPFYLWIHDLSAQDPYYVLPLLMMVSMVIQTKLNPVPPDPVQAKVMMIMPFAFGVMFFFFPAGLVLYWLVNNILSIAQQWQITRMIGDGKTPSKR